MFRKKPKGAGPAPEPTYPKSASEFLERMKQTPDRKGQLGIATVFLMDNEGLHFDDEVGALAERAALILQLEKVFQGALRPNGIASSDHVQLQLLARYAATSRDGRLPYVALRHLNSLIVAVQACGTRSPLVREILIRGLLVNEGAWAAHRHRIASMLAENREQSGLTDEELQWFCDQMLANINGSTFDEDDLRKIPVWNACESMFSRTQ
jgi:hypothetical protein